MDPITISGLATAGASGLSAVAGFLGNERSNSQTQASTREQMEFQKYMDNTKYQRSMADMKAAGLNPILAYKNGAGGAPSGSSATMTNSVAAGADAFGKTVNSAMALSAQKMSLEKLRHETDKAYEDYKSSKETNVGLSLDNWSRNFDNQLKIRRMPAIYNLVDFENNHPDLMKTERSLSILGNALGAGNSAKTLLTK